MTPHHDTMSICRFLSYLISYFFVMIKHSNITVGNIIHGHLMRHFNMHSAHDIMIKRCIFSRIIIPFLRSISHYSYYHLCKRRREYYSFIIVIITIIIVMMEHRFQQETMQRLEINCLIRYFILRAFETRSYLFKDF